MLLQVLKELYDQDVLVEEALLAWADEKASAGAEDTVFLRKVCPSCAESRHRTQPSVLVDMSELIN